MNPIAVVGLDVSLGATGIAIEKRGSAVLHTIRPPSHLRDYVRHGWLVERIVAMTRHGGYSRDGGGYAPDLVVIEGYDLHPKGAWALIRAAEVAGPVRAALARLAIPFLDVPPAQLKQFACGRGNAPKPDVVAAARAEGVDPRDDNAADAYWLWRIGHYHYGTGPAGPNTPPNWRL